MFQPQTWPRAILHLDANAFFASVMQTVYPKLKNKPVVVGAERGIATAISYEAKQFGVKRGMLMHQIKKICPKIIILKGDYALFSLFSQKLFNLLRQYNPTLEEHSVDEGFMDIYGLRRPYHCSYLQLAQRIQQQINRELGLPVSIGVSLTKSLAKLGSGFCKPQGITLIPGNQIESFLSKIPLIKVWGIGPATTGYLKQFKINNALEFVNLPEAVFQNKTQIRLNKAHWEIYQELRGNMVYRINPETKTKYQSIGKQETFRPATNNLNLLWAYLQKNTEAAFQKARQYGYFVSKFLVILKSQQFQVFCKEVKLSQKQQYPWLCRQQLKTAFTALYQPNTLYRATGILLTQLSQNSQEQAGLFNEPSEKPLPKIKALYQILEQQPKIDFGTSLYLQTKPSPASAKKLKTLPQFSLPMLEI